MFALILSGVLIGGLLAWLAVVRYRERRTQRALGLGGVVRSPSSRPDPELVDRPFDPSLCGYCEDPSKFQCPACRRPVCAMHKPWLEHQFCYSCETEWASTARRRTLILLPIMVIGMSLIAATAGVVMVAVERMGYRGDKIAVAALIGPVLAAAPIYLGAERFLRRWFRQRGGLPQATARRT